MGVLTGIAIGLALLAGAITIERVSAATTTWDDVEAWIVADATEYGVSAPWLLSVAWCEARGNPYAVGRLGEVGPFQFHPRGVWWETPAGRAGISPWNLRENVRMAAWAFSRGLWTHWSCA